MEINGSINTKVEIDPIDVLSKLIEKEQSYWRSYVFEKDGKYYEGYEVSLGNHSMDKMDEITKDKYEYIRGLQNAIEYLQTIKLYRKDLNIDERRLEFNKIKIEHFNDKLSIREVANAQKVVFIDDDLKTKTFKSRF